MGLSAHHFWSHVAGCTTCVFAVVGIPDSRNSKISNAKVTILIEDKVFRLDITMEDAVSVKKLEAEDHTSNEEFCLLFREASVLTDVVSKISTLHQIDHEVQIVSVLESIVHVHQERMVQLTEELLFVHYGIHASL